MQLVIQEFCVCNAKKDTPAARKVAYVCILCLMCVAYSFLVCPNSTASRVSGPIVALILLVVLAGVLLSRTYQQKSMSGVIVKLLISHIQVVALMSKGIL